MFRTMGRLGVTDILIGEDGVPAALTGDAPEMSGDDRGGNDLLISGRNPDGEIVTDFSFLTGDALEMGGNSIGGDDVLIARGGWTVFLRGDAEWMTDFAQGGDDVLVGANEAFSNIMVGDAETLGDDGETPSDGVAQGGNDLLIGGNNTENMMYGDALSLVRTAIAGDDTLIGGDRSTNIMRGDSQENGGTSSFGDDVLTGGRYAQNDISGDGNMVQGPVGGNDLIRGGGHSDNLLQGDARYLMSAGGDDTLIASNTGTNTLCGDAYQMLNRAKGGDDTLISGRGDDQLWGDAKFRSGIYLGEASEEEWYENPPEIDETTGGADRFVFARRNGDDTIHDFVQGDDLIDLRLIARIDDFDDVRITVEDGNSVIHLGRGNSITVIGVDALEDSDFLFG